MEPSSTCLSAGRRAPAVDPLTDRPRQDAHGDEQGCEEIHDTASRATELVPARIQLTSPRTTQPPRPIWRRATPTRSMQVRSGSAADCWQPGIFLASAGFVTILGRQNLASSGDILVVASVCYVLSWLYH